MFQEKQNKGFALLLTLVVVSVVLAIGLSLLDITLKQLVLSGTARDSEIAFHAAYAGVECAEYWVRDDVTAFIGSSPIDPESCFPGGSVYNSSSDTPASDVHKSNYEISWTAGPDDNRCTDFDIFILDAEDAEVTYDFGSIGYTARTCSDGSICTYIFSRGLNRSCDDTTSLRTVQREVVSQF